MNRLIDVAQIEVGYPFRGQIAETRDSPYYVLQMKDMSFDQGFLWAGCRPVELSGKKKPAFLQQDELIFVSRGNHYFTLHLSEPPPIQVVASPYLFVIRVIDKAVSPAYLAWYLNQQPCQRYFEQNAEGSVTRSIRRLILENTPIAIPILDKQTKIVQLASNITQQERITNQWIQNGQRLMNQLALSLTKRS